MAAPFPPKNRGVQNMAIFQKRSSFLVSPQAISTIQFRTAVYEVVISTEGEYLC